MPAEPPANGGYMVAAYVVAGAILLGYFVSLLRRAKQILRKQ
jgi:CcmD family protein